MSESDQDYRFLVTPQFVGYETRHEAIACATIRQRESGTEHKVIPFKAGSELHDLIHKVAHMTGAIDSGLKLPQQTDGA